MQHKIIMNIVRMDVRKDIVVQGGSEDCEYQTTAVLSLIREAQ